MLNQRYAVIDLETSGNNFNTDKILEIGVVFVENGQIVDEYSTFFCDTDYITPFISELTNITVDMIKNAPTFKSKAHEIYELIKDCTFVAHNVSFDLTFLQNAFKTYGIDYMPLQKLDTVTLSKIMYPMERTYQLAPLTESLGIELKSAHRALDDAKATAHLLLSIFKELSGINRHTQIIMFKIAKSLDSDVASLLFSSISNTKDKETHDLIRIDDIYVRKIDVHKESTYNFKIETLYEKFLKYKNFKHRDEQLELIYIIYDALKNNKKAAIEAYTGLGKSEAMLIASIVYSDETGNQVLISTSKRLLQNQLFFNSVYDLLKSSNIEHYNISMLKGKNNYVDLEAVNTLMKLENDNHEIMMLKLKLLVWLQHTMSGDLSEIDLKGPERMYYMSALNQNSQSNDYFYKESLNRAKHSNIIITNHYYLFNCLEEIPTDHIVVDEAHQLKGALETSLEETFKYPDLKFLMSQIGLDKKDQLLTEYLKHNNFQNGHYFEAIISEISEHIDVIFQSLNKNEFKRAIKYLNLSIEKLNIFINMLFGTNEFQNLFNYLHNYKIRLSKMLNALNKDQFEVKKAKNYTKTIFTVQKDSKKALYKKAQDILSQVLISGTLEVKGEFKHLEKWFGESTFDQHIIRSESLFKDVELFIPNDISDFKDSDNFMLDLIDYLTILLESKHQKAVILFTNYEQLNETYEMMMDTDLFNTIPVLKQTPKITPDKLLIQYNQLSRCLLLATSSFTEGVNIENTDEKIIFLTKLPFPVPNKDNFKQFYSKELPEAVFIFRQILGRLKRSDTDKGKLILFDERLLTKNYSNAFLKYFEKDNITHQDRYTFIDWLSDL